MQTYMIYQIMTHSTRFKVTKPIYGLKTDTQIVQND